ncbi:MarR family winged helix-turn-helix transcriptional regulator [Clostridium sp. Marseille-P2415]|uniref:MarR family winged helix-turn-helix transcriptional regulator n=1 Tax=Clostridium sp. Marseille-P2415 TaxID=1805471 RepID=UPI0009886F7F|nr:MarR family transcriptional regulator [Clostridium sp. Marseille-P2415]
MDLLTLARYVGILNRQTQSYITAAFSSLDINFSECIIFMNLFDKEGINQEELSSMLFIDKAATARTIKSLERKGFITREVPKDDRRAKKLFLTDKGRNYKSYFYSLLEKWENCTTEGLNKEMINLVFKGIQTMAENSSNANFAELTGQTKEGN